MKFNENKERREVILKRLEHEKREGGHPHLHEIWPCVRKGMGERLMRRLGIVIPQSRRASLAFLRGNEREGPLTRAIEGGMGRIAAYVRLTSDGGGVIMRPDAQNGRIDHPFTEIKSTVMSSRNAWDIIKHASGEINLLDPFTGGFMRRFFEQCCGYCVGMGSTGCELAVSWERGSYAEQQKNCPDCKGQLGPLRDNLFKDCPQCGFRAYKVDFRVYDLEFSAEELAWWDNELYTVRATQAHKADTATTKGQLLAWAPPTPNFYCGDCAVGQGVGCEYYGKPPKD